jgi:hypothetical protein
VKDQYKRIPSKIFKNWYQAEIDDNISYNLSYTNLAKQALPLIYRAREAIIIGDHHQIPHQLLPRKKHLVTVMKLMKKRVVS